MSPKQSQHLNADSKTSRSNEDKDIIDGDQLFSEDITEDTTHNHSDAYHETLSHIEDSHPNKAHLDKLKSLISNGHYTICNDKMSKVAEEILNDPEVSIGLQ
tara:strand:- start:232 stop:537 length:306 start_codon:yes stop_codon:yes gene_type:complete